MAKDQQDKHQAPDAPQGHRKRGSESTMDEGVRESFPASDPVANTATQGARAVPPERMMRKAGEGAEAAGGGVTIAARFPDHEAAKLAVETLVRDAPLDRHCAEIRAADDAVLVEVKASAEEAERLRDMLRRAGGS